MNGSSGLNGQGRLAGATGLVRSWWQSKSKNVQAAIASGTAVGLVVVILGALAIAGTLGGSDGAEPGVDVGVATTTADSTAAVTSTTLVSEVAAEEESDLDPIVFAQPHASTGATPTTASLPSSKTGLWTKVATDGPSHRIGPSMVYDTGNGRFILFGGSSAGQPMNDLWAYEPRAKAWSRLTPEGPLPPGRYDHSMVYVPTIRKVIVFGGGGSRGQLGDLWAYDTVANTWSNLTPTGSAPSPRHAPAMAYDAAADKVVLFGGGQNAGMEELWIYDPSTNSWAMQRASGNWPAGRSYGTMAYDAKIKKVVLFGGMGEGDPPKFLNDLWTYDATAKTWARLSPTGGLPAGRVPNPMVYDAVTDRLVIFGGEAFQEGRMDVVDDLWAYDVSAKKWTNVRLTGVIPAARFKAALACDPSTGSIVVFGGSSGGSAVPAETWQLDIE